MSTNPNAPALGMSLQFDLGAGRVATMQTFVDRDASERQINELLDKMTRAGDRQRAHYKIEELERQLEIEEKLAKQHAEDMARLDAEHAAKQKQREAEIARLRAAVDKTLAAAKDAHLSSGRRGEFALKGADKSNANAVQAGIKRLQDEMAQAQAECDTAHVNSDVTRRRRQELIDGFRADIARCQEIFARKGDD